MSEQFDPYYRWLGIRPEDQPPHHYRLLGLSVGESNREVIRDAADRQMAHVRTYQLGPQSALSQRVLNELGAAAACLLDPQKKAAYDARLRREMEPAQRRPEPPAATAPPAVLRKKKTLAVGVGAGLAGIAGIVVVLLMIRSPHPDGKELVVAAPEGSPAAVGAKPDVDGAIKVVSDKKPLPPAAAPLGAGKVERPRSEPAKAVAPEKPAQPVTVAKEQRDIAERLGLPVELTNSVGMRLVLIPPGEFDMGSTPEEVAQALEWGKKNNMGKAFFDRVASEKPRHRVTITRPFYLAIYQATQGEYEKVMGVNPSSIAEKQIDASRFNPPLVPWMVKVRLDDQKAVVGHDTSRYPVETVNWHQATEFCHRLSAMPVERTAGRVYRLPAEAEWEYACRAGTTTRWSCGDDEAGLADVAWFRSNSGFITHPVGHKKPNAWGLHDMYGNVSQWCADWFGTRYYEQSPSSDPAGPSEGPTRVLRGGDNYAAATSCRSASRDGVAQNFYGHTIGFRVAMEIASSSPTATAAVAQPATGAQAAPSQPAAASPVVRQAPPGEAEQEKALKAAQDEIKAQWQQAQTPVAKGALAKQLLQQAIDRQNDGAGKFALFELARDMAAEAGDWELVQATIHAQAEAFVVDRFEIGDSVLADWAKRPQNLAERSALVEKIIKLLDEALDAPDVAAADSLCKLAVSEAAKSHLKVLVQRAQNCKKRLAEAHRTAEILVKAQAALAANPNDEEAKLVVGRQLCFGKGDWEKGLPMLAHGSDEALRTLAQQDLAAQGSGPSNPQSPPSNPQSPIPNPLLLADAWWNLALAATGTQKERLMLHAGRWYGVAAEDSPAGREGTKIEKRLLEIAKLRARLPSPPPAVTPLDAQRARERQQAWAEYLGVPVKQANGLGMPLVLIPPGEFEMGPTPGDVAWALEDHKKRWGGYVGHLERLLSERPQHHVRISRPFRLAMYPVTQAEYEKVMGVNPSAFTEKQADLADLKLDQSLKKEREDSAKRVAGRDTSRHPVEMVTWDEAMEFCRRLSAMPSERAAGRVYRLPTEAEWEYACRAGTTTHWYSGDDEVGVREIAWFGENSGGTTRPVGGKKPNAWGLFDMHGNVCQWCADRFGKDYYGQSPTNDPAGPAAGAGRVVRGGSWRPTLPLRSAFRDNFIPFGRSLCYGFRVAVGR
jgi:formylglycine-generating enzyme required for sulfatase activity